MENKTWEDWEKRDVPYLLFMMQHLSEKYGVNCYMDQSIETRKELRQDIHFIQDLLLSRLYETKM